MEFGKITYNNQALQYFSAKHVYVYICIDIIFLKLILQKISELWNRSVYKGCRCGFVNLNRCKNTCHIQSSFHHAFDQGWSWVYKHCKWVIMGTIPLISMYHFLFTSNFLGSPSLTVSRKFWWACLTFLEIIHILSCVLSHEKLGFSCVCFFTQMLKLYYLLLPKTFTGAPRIGLKQVSESPL